MPESPFWTYTGFRAMVLNEDFIDLHLFMWQMLLSTVTYKLMAESNPVMWKYIYLFVIYDQKAFL